MVAFKISANGTIAYVNPFILTHPWMGHLVQLRELAALNGTLKDEEYCFICGESGTCNPL